VGEGSAPVTGFRRNGDLTCQGQIKWLKKQWAQISGGRPFVLKGIQCVEDAQKAVEYGCDGIVVSNHAGRQVGEQVPGTAMQERD
jgi:isopentenyl diphosphate isomerase/L-lactate dehydrogenase-like FMN-dependent dehydrogenase